MLLRKSLAVLAIILGSLSCEGRAGKNSLEETDAPSNSSKRIKIENLLNSPEDDFYLSLSSIEEHRHVLATLPENGPQRVQEASRLMHTISRLYSNFGEFKSFLENFDNKGPEYKSVRVSIIKECLEYTQFLRHQSTAERITNLLDLAKFLPINYLHRLCIIEWTLLNSEGSFDLWRTINDSFPESQIFIYIAQLRSNSSLLLKATELLGRLNSKGGDS